MLDYAATSMCVNTRKVRGECEREQTDGALPSACAGRWSWRPESHENARHNAANVPGRIWGPSDVPDAQPCHMLHVVHELLEERMGPA